MPAAGLLFSVDMSVDFHVIVVVCLLCVYVLCGFCVVVHINWLSDQFGLSISQLVIIDTSQFWMFSMLFGGGLLKVCFLPILSSSFCFLILCSLMYFVYAGWFRWCSKANARNSSSFDLRFFSSSCSFSALEVGASISGICLSFCERNLSYYFSSSSYFTTFLSYWSSCLLHAPVQGLII